MQKQRTQRSKIEKDNIKSRSRCENICYETFLQKKCRSFPKKYRYRKSKKIAEKYDMMHTRRIQINEY